MVKIRRIPDTTNIISLKYDLSEGVVMASGVLGWKEGLAELMYVTSKYKIVYQHYAFVTDSANMSDIIRGMCTKWVKFAIALEKELIELKSPDLQSDLCILLRRAQWDDRTWDFKRE